MSADVLLVVLAAACLHAIWNATVKASGDTTQAAVLVSVFATIFAIATLPFLPAPAPPSWPFIALSTVLQVVYYLTLSAAYRAGDMSQTYPLMRGTAPLIVAVASGPLIGEALSLSEWAGLLMISGGVIAMSGLAGARGNRKAALLALLTAGIIATYTLVDGAGVRRSGSPIAYSMWILLLPSVPLVALMLRTPARARAFLAFARRRAAIGAVGGAGTLASYSMVLWAMTQAPVALVAALRETSILFAIAISALVLKEKVTGGRLVATAVIAAGAAVLRMA
jgi:drug/metabolite transporter (DMT)-like permease